MHGYIVMWSFELVYLPYYKLLGSPHFPFCSPLLPWVTRIISATYLFCQLTFVQLVLNARNKTWDLWFFPIIFAMEHKVRIINLLTCCEVNDSRRATNENEVGRIYSWKLYEIPLLQNLLWKLNELINRISKCIIKYNMYKIYKIISRPTVKIDYIYYCYHYCF